MIIVTGGAGFIGSNLVKALNKEGEREIIVVDEVDAAGNPVNLADCSFVDLVDKAAYLDLVKNGNGVKGTRYVFHQGACFDTTEQDGKYMMENNYAYSKALFHHCVDNLIPFIYASSAAIYGGAEEFAERPANETPLNIYARSKFLFDNYARYFLGRLNSQVVGLRYFNVFGPRESHKGHMASVAYHVFQQLDNEGRARLFKGTGGFGDGEQMRDFVYVEDAVALNLWFMKNENVSGVFNVGTGQPRAFNDVANTLIQLMGHGEIEYVEFPEKLKGKYQSYTCANLAQLRDSGCDYQFHSLEKGLEKYLGWLLEGHSQG